MVRGLCLCPHGRSLAVAAISETLLACRLICSSLRSIVRHMKAGSPKLMATMCLFDGLAIPIHNASCQRDLERLPSTVGGGQDTFANLHNFAPCLPFSLKCGVIPQGQTKHLLICTAAISVIQSITFQLVSILVFVLGSKPLFML